MPCMFSNFDLYEVFDLWDAANLLLCLLWHHDVSMTMLFTLRQIFTLRECDDVVIRGFCLSRHTTRTL